LLFYQIITKKSNEKFSLICPNSFFPHSDGHIDDNGINSKELKVYFAVGAFPGVAN
jgi:hypothetical protein